ncbi:hypothetical protein [Streptomyces sp. NBC_00105]|uniref:hypothetical protein n=1 Tax=unclassified Streptomyces TaxID=2593676 RepID=UPI00288377AC|nr:hypothetical protein [Streptomyces sp. DSM 41633]
MSALKEAGSVARGAGFPEVRCGFTVPKTLPDDKYLLAQALSDTEGREVLKGSSGSNVRNPKHVAGQYTSDSPTGTSTLVISAMYGRFKDIGGVSLAVPARGAAVRLGEREHRRLGRCDHSGIAQLER